MRCLNFPVKLHGPGSLKQLKLVWKEFKGIVNKIFFPRFSLGNGYSSGLDSNRDVVHKKKVFVAYLCLL